MITTVMRGADPELFLRSTISGLPVTSIGLIGGTKRVPRDIGNGFALQEDNVAVEFNIPPADTSEKFVASLQFALKFLEDELKPKGLALDCSASMEFLTQQLDHPQAQELGCEPDLNAWTTQYNPRPVAPPTLRSAGGHLHLSWDNPTVDERFTLVKLHDLFCGVPSIKLDNDTKRRSIYGKAGACRLKKYGVEYRTPSNFWLKSEAMMRWMYTQSEKAISFFNNGGVIAKEDEKKIQDCINNSDHALFDELNAKYSLV